MYVHTLAPFIICSRGRSRGCLKRRNFLSIADGSAGSQTKKCNSGSCPGTPVLVSVTMRPQNSLQNNAILRAHFWSHEVDGENCGCAEHGCTSPTGSPLVSSPREDSPVVIRPIKSHRSQKLREVRLQEVQQAIRSWWSVTQLHKKVRNALMNVYNVRHFEHTCFPLSP